MKRYTGCGALILLCCLTGSSLYGASVTANWVGGISTSWSDTGNWDCGCLPANNVANTFGVTIDSAGATVSLDTISTIDTLVLGNSFPESRLSTTSGSSLTIGTPLVAAPVLLSGGTINVNAGGPLTIDLSGGGGAFNIGTINVNDGGVLTLASGPQPSVQFDNDGFINIGSGGAVGANLTLAGSASGPSQFTLSGVGSLFLADAAANSIKGALGTESLINDSSHLIEGSGTIGNLASFTNAGTLLADGTNALAVKTRMFLNTGSVVVAPGSVADFRTGGTGTFLNLSGGTLDGGTFTVGGTLYFDPNGDASAGKITAIGSGGVLGLVGSGQLLAGGTGSVGATNALSQVTGNQGQLALYAGATLSTTSLDNSGFVAITRGFPDGSLDPSAPPTSLTVTGAFTNEFLASLAVGLGVDGASFSSGSFSNDGFFLISSGSSASVGSFVQTDPSALTLVDAGATLTGDIRLNGGILTGTGTIVGNLDNEATDHPGGPGTQTITGNYTQIAGLLQLDFGGLDPLTGFDNLAIGGDVALGGSLEIDLIDGFAPSAGDVFKILSWGSGRTLTGDFSMLVFPSLAELGFIEVIDRAHNDIEIDVVATPEPATFVMLFSAMLIGGVAYKRRRRV